MLDRIRQLITADKLEKAIEELLPHVSGKNEELTNDLIKYQAELAKSKKDSRRGLITGEEESKTRNRVTFAVLEMLPEIEEEAGPLPAASPPGGANTGSGAPTVFISYNHGDSEVADKLKAALGQNGIAVRIDHAVMEAGESIQEFIESSIRDTDVTLSIVSNRSLLSAWVALESIGTFYHEKFTGNKKFIACYIDDDFFQKDYQEKAIEQIDARIAEIVKQISKHDALQIDTKVLNSEKSRLIKLRNELDDILLRLVGALCLDIRGEKFDGSVAKIVSAIKGKG